MSCYQWESGEIKIPAADWSKFRTAIITCWNDHQLSLLEKAKALHAKVKAAAKGKRGKNRDEAIRKALGTEWDLMPLVIERSYDRDSRQETLTLKGLPKKKDLGLLPTSKDATLDVGDASVRLCNKTRTVSWDVGENNRACEHARETFLGKELFRLLARIEWTRGTGGKIVGNDEYNRDNRDCGGGGNYVTTEFSQAKQKRDREAAKHQPRYGGYGGGYGRRW